MAVVLSGCDRFFLYNFAYQWAPQALLLGAVLLFRPRAAITAGVALASTVYLLAFWAWMHSLPPGQALAWLFYFVMFPGALLGAIAAALVSRRRPEVSAICAGVGAAAVTLTGVAAAMVGATMKFWVRWP